MEKAGENGNDARCMPTLYISARGGGGRVGEW